MFADVIVESGYSVEVKPHIVMLNWQDSRLATYAGALAWQNKTSTLEEVKALAKTVKPVPKAGVPWLPMGEWVRTKIAPDHYSEEWQTETCVCLVPQFRRAWVRGWGLAASKMLKVTISAIGDRPSNSDR